MKALINCHSEKSRYLLSALCVVLLMLITWTFLQLRFETNDDVGIMYVVAGYRTGSPSPFTLFTNIIFGYLLSGLYALAPIIPWFGITHIVLIFISLTMILKSLIKICVLKETPLAIPFTLFFFLYIFFLLHYTAALQFSTTPAMAGTAACVLAASLFNDESKRARMVDYIAIVFLLFISYIIRSESGLVALCYFAVVIAFKVVKIITAPDRCTLLIRPLIIISVCTAVLLPSAKALDTYLADRNGMREFYSFYRQLSGYIDSPITPYADAPEMYASIGWDSNLQSLVNSWFFMDERVSEESFATINEFNAANRQGLTGVDRIKSEVGAITGSIYGLLSRSAYAVSATMVFMIVYCLHLIVLLKQKNWLQLVLMLAVLGGLLLTSLFLGYIGRFILRAYFVTLIPAASLLFWSVADVWVADRLKGRSGYAILTLSLVLFAFFLIIPFRRAYEGSRTYRENAADSRRVATEQYVINNSDKIYIFDNSLASTMPVFTRYLEQKPVNSFFWGGTGIKAPIFTKQLEANGINELSARSLLQPGFFFITAYSYEDRPLFYDYMESEFNAAATVVDTFNSLYVIQFTQK